MDLPGFFFAQAGTTIRNKQLGTAGQLGTVLCITIAYRRSIGKAGQASLVWLLDGRQHWPPKRESDQITARRVRRIGIGPNPLRQFLNMSSTTASIAPIRKAPTAVAFLGFSALLILAVISQEHSTNRNIFSALLVTPTAGATRWQQKLARFGATPAVPDTLGETHNFTVAACVIVKDAEAYFEEWIDYHVGAMKVDQVYLYDHSVDFELERWYINSRADPIYRKTEVMHYKFTGHSYNEEKDGYNQNVVYGDCMDRFGKDGPKHDYMIFIDIDEFLVPQDERFSSVHSILEEYLVPFGGALVVNWMLFGTANKTVYSPVPVTKRFQYRESEAHGVIKSIVKSSDYRSHKNPHGVNLLGNATVHTTSIQAGSTKQSVAQERAITNVPRT